MVYVIINIIQVQFPVLIGQKMLLTDSESSDYLHILEVNLEVGMTTMLMLNRHIYFIENYLFLLFNIN